MDLPFRAKLVVVMAAVRAAFCWAVAAAAVTAPIWVNLSLRRFLTGAVVFAVVWVAVAGAEGWPATEWLTPWKQAS